MTDGVTGCCSAVGMANDYWAQLRATLAGKPMSLVLIYESVNALVAMKLETEDGPDYAPQMQMVKPLSNGRGGFTLSFSKTSYW